MRQVTNQTNASVLGAFRAQVIEPAFDAVSQLGTGTTTVRGTSAFHTLQTDGRAEALDRALGVQVAGKSLEGELLSLSQAKVAPTVDVKKLFQTQTAEVAAGNYAIAETAIPKGWHRVFANFFYERFLSDAELWTLLGHPGYGREKFHENFATENGPRRGVPLGVCPYCDLDTIQSIGNSQVEHFLPKSKYPFLAMSPHNLLSSCLGCNNPGSGKGTRTAPKVVMPYNCEVGTQVEFSVDHARERIDLSDGGDAQVRGFIDLVQLPRRYAKERLYRLVTVNVAEVLESVSGHAATEAELRSYFQRCRLHHPLYYVTREECVRVLKDECAYRRRGAR